MIKHSDQGFNILMFLSLLKQMMYSSALISHLFLQMLKKYTNVCFKSKGLVCAKANVEIIHYLLIHPETSLTTFWISLRGGRAV